jgi:uncharacterized protein YmfQ (DUF2313 family)
MNDIDKPAVDKHVRRSGRDYAEALYALLPQGQAWPKQPGTTLHDAIVGFAAYWGFVDSRAADLLERETDPRYAMEMFPDWERAWGLPDPCFFHDSGDMGSRRAILMLKMTLLGGQSREFFYWVANQLGYSISIREYSPFMVGVSQVGDVRDDAGYPRWTIGPPEMRFYWSVNVAGVSLVWFRVNAGQTGIDPHLRIGIPEDLECLLNKWKPAHTEIVFDFGDPPMNPMTGTP